MLQLGTFDTDPSEPDKTRSFRPLSDRAAWIVVLLLTLLLSSGFAFDSVRHYHRFETRWSWDLAYYNQWYWALTRGDQTLTVRPIAAYADEGPSVWKTNYVSPLRFALIPIHLVFPDPRALLVTHAFLFCLFIPAAFTLARSETDSNRIAVLATMLMIPTPLIYALGLNDFREIQLAIPFVLWGIQGVRQRSWKVAGVGIIGMLACRQELAVVVSSLAILEPKEREDVGRGLVWRHLLLMIGLVWIVLVFFGHLRYWAGSEAPARYLGQFGGDGPLLDQTLLTASEIVAIGLGSCILFWPMAPREALLALPWIWSLAHGKWALRSLATEDWHHVRYATPIVATGMAAGIIGFVRMAERLKAKHRNGLILYLAFLPLMFISLLGRQEVSARMKRHPRDIDSSEVAVTWKWIERVGPSDGVLTAYEVAAPLSSRRSLYSYRLPVNQPKGYPQLSKEMAWIFFHNRDGSTEIFEKQGFKVVHRGTLLTILSRQGS